MRKHNLKYLLPLVLTGVCAFLALLFAPFPNEAPLHHIPTLTLIVASPFILNKYPLSGLSVWLICVFLLFHTLGGFYNYSFVPYREWLQMLNLATESASNDFARNQYDRWVHFSFGFLMMIPFTEIARKYFKCPSFFVSIFLAFMLINSISAIYEIFEWGLTVYMANDFALEYNGQQGDIWDAQKDMASALMGALIMGIAMRFFKQKLDAIYNAA